MKKKISLKAEDILPDENISKSSLTEILSSNKDIDDQTFSGNLDLKISPEEVLEMNCSNYIIYV